MTNAQQACTTGIVVLRANCAGEVGKNRLVTKGVGNRHRADTFFLYNFWTSLDVFFFFFFVSLLLLNWLFFFFLAILRCCSAPLFTDRLENGVLVKRSYRTFRCTSTKIEPTVLYIFPKWRSKRAPSILLTKCDSNCQVLLVHVPIIELIRLPILLLIDLQFTLL